MITAEAGTEVGHRAMSYRSKSPYGPWEHNPNNPIVYNGRKWSILVMAHIIIGNLSQPVLSTGHVGGNVFTTVDHRPTILPLERCEKSFTAKLRIASAVCWGLGP